MNKQIVWAWAMKNSVDIICWTLLAVHFEKWWIALFAALFVSGMKSTIQKCRTCDGCGRHSPYADSHNEALEKAAAAGWITRKNGTEWEDYCPECQRRLRDAETSEKSDREN